VKLVRFIYIWVKDTRKPFCLLISPQGVQDIFDERYTNNIIEMILVQQILPQRVRKGEKWEERENFEI